MDIKHGARALRAVFAALVISGSLSGCLTMNSYVDPALPKVSSSDFNPPAQSQAVNVLFEFRTKGNANARATQTVRPMVLLALHESKQFSEVIEGASGQGKGVLKIVIDNVPITDNAAAKGFGTGLTLGLAGSMVTDGYICTMSYTADGVTTETTVKHALHTTIGNHSGPAGLTAMRPEEAVSAVVNQMVLNALKDLRDQHALAGTP